MQHRRAGGAVQGSARKRMAPATGSPNTAAKSKFRAMNYIAYCSKADKTSVPPTCMRATHQSCTAQTRTASGLIQMSHKGNPPTQQTGLSNKQRENSESPLAVEQEVSPTWATRAAVKRRNMSCDTGTPPFPHRTGGSAPWATFTLWVPRGNSVSSDDCLHHPPCYATCVS